MSVDNTAQSDIEKKEAGITLRGICRQCVPRLGKRTVDVYTVVLFFSGVVLGYLHATIELLQPPDECLVWNIVGHVLFLLFFASWFSIAYHGPGRVLQDGPKHTQPPLVLSQAIEACNKIATRPFTEWCSACDHVKSPLVSHCTICRRCSIWMDHHCHFAAQCVGFRNKRCFILWLFYTGVLFAFLVLLAFRRLFVGPKISLWGYMRMAAFVAVLLERLKRAVYSHVKDELFKIGTGWASEVSRLKFGSVAVRAVHIGVDIERIAPDHKLVLTLRRALTAVSPGDKTRPRRFTQITDHLQGPFLGYCWGLIFGSAPSFRWLVPFIPGGYGDPMQPDVVNVELAGAWTHLANVTKDAIDSWGSEKNRLVQEMFRRQQVQENLQNEFNAKMQKWLAPAKVPVTSLP